MRHMHEVLDFFGDMFIRTNTLRVTDVYDSAVAQPVASPSEAPGEDPSGADCKLHLRRKSWMRLQF